MEKDLKAIKTSGKVIAYIMKICYIAMIVVFCISAITLIILIATGGETSFTTSGGTKIVFADELPSYEVGVATSASLVIMAVFLIPIFLLTYRVFNEINKTGVPFNKKHVSTIKAIGLLVALMGGIGGAVDSIFAHYADMYTLGIYSDTGGALTGGIIFCLAYIYSYGCTLQKRADEAGAADAAADATDEA